MALDLSEPGPGSLPRGKHKGTWFPRSAHKAPGRDRVTGCCLGTRPSLQVTVGQGPPMISLILAAPRCCLELEGSRLFRAIGSFRLEKLFEVIEPNCCPSTANPPNQFTKHHIYTAFKHLQGWELSTSACSNA